nr:clp protease proteolytic subunit [Evolvulus alsinoides]
MPIGVPKVPFRNPGDEDASWIDIYNRLYRQRCLFLAQPIDNQISNQLAGLLIYLSIEDPNKDLFLFINSPGGGVMSGITLYDTMQMVAPDVQTICIGLAASMASLILAGRGRNYQTYGIPSRRVMIHQPMSSFFEAQAGEVVLETKEVMKLRENLTQAYVNRTGKPDWLITQEMERDNFLSAREAKVYGIIDYVADELFR